MKYAASSNFHFLRNIQTCSSFSIFCQMEAVNSQMLNCFLEFDFEELNSNWWLLLKKPCSKYLPESLPKGPILSQFIGEIHQAPGWVPWLNRQDDMGLCLFGSLSYNLKHVSLSITFVEEANQKGQRKEHCMCIKQIQNI